MSKLECFIGQSLASKAREDHSGNDYSTENGRMTVHVSGHYTQEELQQKLRELREANELHDFYSHRLQTA